jgi:excinuclease UvrABC helicase subunit UvrB
MDFRLQAPFQPAGDQTEAIRQRVEGLPIGPGVGWKSQNACGLSRPTLE